jgi:hypothetical protein
MMKFNHGEQHKLKAGVFAIGIACISILIPTSGANASATCETLSSETANEFISDYANQLMSQGLTQVEIISEVNAHFCLSPVAARPNFGIQPLASTNADVKLTAPSVSYDSATKFYYSLTGWSWQNTKYASEVSPASNSNVSIGNDDGFGTYISGAPFAISSTLTYGSAGCYFYPTNALIPSSSSGDGFTYEFQDIYRLSNGRNCNNSYSGQLSIKIANPTSCQDIGISSRYAHTWSSTSISGFSIAPNGFSLSFSSANYRWAAASNPISIFTLC